jgi:hypothetical protein
LLALVAVLFFFDLRPNTVEQNDSAAIGRLRRLSEAQDSYAAQNPNKGFACNLSDIAGESQYSGYRFSLVCNHPAGKSSSYELIAQPLTIGKTGLRTYCITEKKEVWFGADGSASDCLATRQPIDR